MRVLIACKRGNIAERDKYGHCLCIDCTEFNRARYRRNNNSPSKVAWGGANKDKVNAYSKAWASRNPEQRREIERSWKERNPQKVAAINAKSGAKWSKENPGKRNAITNKRRAALRLRTVPWADLAAIQLIYDEAARLSRETGIPHEVDHIYPLMGETVSGLHVEGNLQILTRSENRAKQNKVPE